MGVAKKHFEAWESKNLQVPNQWNRIGQVIVAKTCSKDVIKKEAGQSIL